MAGLKRIAEGTAAVGFALFLTTPLLPQTPATARASLISPPAQQNPGAGNTAKGRQDVRVLEKGKPVERELKGGDTHTYRVRLASGQCLHFIADQRGVDVEVRVIGPDGTLKGTYDSPTGTRGPESVWLLAEAAGDYQFEIRSLEQTAAAGRYEARIEELRAATPQDKSRVAAQRAYAEGLQLSEPGNPDAMRKALEKYDAALPRWRDAGDRAGEADTLFMTGAVHSALGEQKKAIDFFHQSLQIERALGNRANEARALVNLSGAWFRLGEMQKALDCDTQALPLVRATGERQMEAMIFTHMGGIYESTGEKEKALEAYNQALPLWRAISDSNQEAQTLRKITRLRGNR
jgi:Tetratricopeptide repeat